MTQARQHALSVTSRTVAAIFGGYAFISVFTAALTLLLPRISGMPLFEAVTAATMGSFLLWAIVAMAVFSARTATRAWIGLIIVSIPPALVFIALKISGT